MLLIWEAVIFFPQLKVRHLKTQLLSLPWPPSPEGLWLNELWRASVASWDRCSAWCIRGSDRRTASVEGPRQEKRKRRENHEGTHRGKYCSVLWNVTADMQHVQNTTLSLYMDSCTNAVTYVTSKLDINCYKTMLTTCHQTHKHIHASIVFI